MSIQKMYLFAGLAVAAFVFWLSRKGNAQSVGVAVGTGAANLIVGTAEGVVVGASSVLGIPAVSQSKCDTDLAAGNYWQASFDCPAGDFIGGILGGKSAQSQGATPSNSQVILY